MMVMMISLASKRAFRKPAMPPHRAPPTNPPASTRSRCSGSGSGGHRAHQGGPQCPQKDLPLRADIPDACPERHVTPRARPGPAASRAPGSRRRRSCCRATPQRTRERLERVDAEQGNHGAGDDKGRHDRGQGNTEAASAARIESARWRPRPRMRPDSGLHRKCSVRHLSCCLSREGLLGCTSATHHQPDLLQIGVGGRDRADDAAGTQHGDPIAHGEQFVEVGGDQAGRRARGCAVRAAARARTRSRPRRVRPSG